MGALKLRSKELPPLQAVYMQGESLGIENLKIVLEVIIIFLVDLTTILRKGNWLMLGQTVIKLISYGNIVAIAQIAWEEFKDVSQKESAELTAHFAAKFDLENDHVEEVIETAVSFVPRIYQLVLDAFAVVGQGQQLWEEVRDIFQDKEVEKLAKRISR